MKRLLLIVMATIMALIGATLPAQAANPYEQTIINSGASWDYIRVYSICTSFYVNLDWGDRVRLRNDDCIRVSVVSKSYKIGVVQSDGSYKYGVCNDGPYARSNPNNAKATQVYKTYRNDGCTGN